MLLNTDYMDPQTLTGYARAVLMDLDVNRFTLSRWLPNRPVNDLEYRFFRGGEGLVEAATFRAYDTEAPIAKRPGLSRMSGELPPISRKIPVTEYLRLKSRNLPTEVTSNLLSDTERLIRGIAARMELARGDALVNGSVTIAENGVAASLAFGRQGGHSVTAGASWLTSSTDVIADLMAWTELYRDNNSVEPGVLLTSSKVVNALLKNAGFRSMLAGGLVATPSVITRDSLQQILSAYGLPRIETYDVSVSVGDVATKVIPDDKLLILPSGESVLGATLYGTTAEALSNDFQISASEAPGIVAGSWETKDPINLWTKADAIAMPVLANPDFAFVADVVP
jgi:hypothetical protein